MLEFIVNAHHKTGEPLPEKIRNAPVLMFGLEFYMTVYEDLSTCRNMNGVIPFLSTEEYCDRHGIEGQQRETVHHHLKAMDKVYSKHSEKTNGKQ